MKNKSTMPQNGSCRKCPAICCHNLALAIGRPVNRTELEDLKWQLHFSTVKVYIHGHHWYQWIKGTCRYLKNNRCTIYEDRPERCRKHNPPNCEYHDKYYDVMFSTPEELEEYWVKKYRSKHRKVKTARKTTRKSPK